MPKENTAPGTPRDEPVSGDGVHEGALPEDAVRKEIAKVIDDKLASDDLASGDLVRDELMGSDPEGVDAAPSKEASEARTLGAAVAALSGPHAAAYYVTPEARRYARKFGLKLSRHVSSIEVIRRVVLGTWNDGFIHAGNFAYMSMLAMFPFFVLGAAAVTAFGNPAEQETVIRTALSTMPSVVRDVIEPVAISVVHARSGWLLWAGALVGLWTTSSLVETVRDMLRRAYGTPHVMAMWKTRLLSTGVIMLLVGLIMFSLLAQVMIGAVQEAISAWVPELANVTEKLSTSRFIAVLGLTIAIYLVFLSLTPIQYRGRAYPKWPGALFVSLWWMVVSFALPIVLREFLSYDLTYGSLAGIMVTLLFFYLIGIGIVVGSELNAALAEPPTVDDDGSEGSKQDAKEVSS